METQQACRSLRQGLTLAATWRVLSELWRRHYGAHDLRLLQTHPGSSELGQLCVLVGPTLDKVMDCIRLVLSVGGSTGIYEVHSPDQALIQGEFLWAFLTDEPVQLVDRLERQLGLQAPAALPTSTPPVLAMRLVAEVLTATCLDRRGLSVETAWMDWSGSVSVKPWAARLGYEVATLQRELDSGQLDWQRAYLSVSSLLRVSPTGGSATSEVECLIDMQAGTVLLLQQGKTKDSVNLAEAYAQAGRRLEPVVARLLAALREG